MYTNESISMSMDHEDLQRDDQQATLADTARDESGMPGDGAGRRDDTGLSGVYPVSDMQGASGDAPVVGAGGVHHHHAGV